ncbi:MAG: RNA polymerase sigma factor [bacterium]|nr:RNA polymerase sigma factor [bacterium]
MRLDNADQFYQTIIEPIQKQMMAVIYRIVHDPDQTADVFQEALYKVWTYLDRIALHPNPQAYILNICTTSAYDFLRKKERERARAMEHAPLAERAVSPSVESQTQSNEVLGLVQKAIASLPVQQAQAVLLRLFNEESFVGIGAALQCTEATARSHYSKGLAKLRLVLQEMNVSSEEAG